MSRVKAAVAALIGLVVLAGVGAGSDARAADSNNRLTFETGIGWASGSSASFLIGAEYEYRFEPVFGVGLLGEYQFSTPSVFRLGAPVYVHPLAGDWVVYGAPILEFSGSTNAGVRFGTRVPIPLGPVSLLPNFAIDLVGGVETYIIGIGLLF